LYVFEQGPIRYVAVVRDASDNGAAKDYAVRLPSSRFIYDCRRRSFIGHSDHFTLRLAPARAAFFALLPCRVRGVRVQTNAGKALHPGRDLTFSVQIETDGVPGDRVAHVELHAPDGSVPPAYASNEVARGGRLRVTIPLAFNDPPGAWTILARDVATGVEGKKTFRISER
jgi:hypothetical protein